MLINKYFSLFLCAIFLFGLLAGCSRKATTEEAIPSSPQVSLTGEENNVFGEVSDTTASLSGQINIEGLGVFTNTIIVPEVIIEGTNGILRFENVEVRAHNLRADIFQPGVVTAIDTILTLAEDGKISYDLKWYESIGTAGVVKSYWVNRINDDESDERCGFVYEAGDETFLFFRGNHNHIPSDIRVINSPQYVKYFRICI